MNIHEFQGKSLLSQFDIPVQPGIVLDLQSNLPSLEILSEKAGEESVFAVKAQIHAGGRGKGKFKEKDAGDGGGVRISQNVNELEVIQDKLMKSVDKKIYIIFELPNYKLRVGNFLNRKEAESFQKKIVRLGYRTAWVVPTMIEMED